MTLIDFAADHRVRAWLASMGHDAMGAPIEVVAGLFVREARRWQMPPDELYALVTEAPAANVYAA